MGYLIDLCLFSQVAKTHNGTVWRCSDDVMLFAWADRGASRIDMLCAVRHSYKSCVECCVCESWAHSAQLGISLRDINTSLDGFINFA